MKISNTRKRILHYGDVFAGLDGIKDQGKKRSIMSKRHNDWMDNKGFYKTDPVTWIKTYMNLHHKKDVVEKQIIKIIEDLTTIDHPIDIPFKKSKTSEYNINFYKNALGYLRKNY